MPVKEPSFKVGDRVRIIADYKWAGRSVLGEVGTILCAYHFAGDDDPDLITVGLPDGRRPPLYAEELEAL